MAEKDLSRFYYLRRKRRNLFGGSAYTFEDTFTDADSTALTSHTMDKGGKQWAYMSHSFLIESNQARDKSYGALAVAVFDHDTSDPDITVDLTVPDSSVYQAGIVFRRAASDQYFRIELSRSGGGTPILNLRRVTTGITSTNVTHVAGSRTLRLVVSGTKVDVYLDDVKEIDQQDIGSLYQAEQNHGLLSYSINITNLMYFDNYKAV